MIERRHNQIESVILPFSVILSIRWPSSASIGRYFDQVKMTDMAQMRCVVRIGVDVNNAIVLVDMVNRFRAEGLDPRTAIVEAATGRF